MDATQISILIGATAAQAIALALPYWIGRNAGQTAGRTAGYDAACAELLPEANSAARERDIALRELRATRAELEHQQDAAQDYQRRSAEKLAALAMERDDARLLAGEHADLLRRAANLLDHTDIEANGWHDAHQVVGSLHELADWLACATAKEALHA